MRIVKLVFSTLSGVNLHIYLIWKGIAWCISTANSPNVKINASTVGMETFSQLRNAIDEI
jgi:hypothetical protein